MEFKNDTLAIGTIEGNVQIYKFTAHVYPPVIPPVIP
jgi:hypothetical protein